MAFDITRTRGKKYVGVCGLGDCEYQTLVGRSPTVGQDLRAHARNVHGVTVETVFSRSLDAMKGPTMKQPGKELPPQEKLSDYIDHYIVFADQRWDERDTKLGKATTVECKAFVFLDGAWKSLGDTPIFWATVQKQIMEDESEPIGGKLTQGTDRNANEYAIVPVPASDKAGTAALKSWDKDKAENF